VLAVKFSSSFLLVIFCWLIDNASAEMVFRWVDERGIIHFADNPQSVPERYGDESRKPPITPFRASALPPSVPKTEPAKLPNPQKLTIPLAREGGRLIVNGNINNQSSVRFIVDTGANMTMIPARLASRLGFNRKESLWIEIRGVGGVIDGRLIEVDSLKVGNAEVRNFDIVVIEDTPQGIGLLGADFLSRFHLDISYSRGQMVLQPGEGPFDGYPATWWQEKFRLYSRLKRTYEQRIKQNKDYLRTLGINPERQNWLGSSGGKINPLQPIADEIKEHENYLRVLENKLSDLQLRANRAELPQYLRQ
jgi:clan AA aspartic protease (TIGR02281 family)